MNELSIFNYGKTEVRTVQVNSEPWFVAKDVAEALGYKWNGNKTIGHIPEEWRGVESVSTPTGNQELIIVSEQGLYFFLGRSDKKAALPMQKWVAGEVLPSIRRNGNYGSPQPINLDDPSFLRQALLTYTEKVIELEATVAEQQPKVEALERIACADGLMCITDAAKTLGIRPKDLFAWMSARQWIYKRAGNSAWIAYQNRLQQGLLEHKISMVRYSDGSEQMRERVMVTAKGLSRIAEIFSVHA